MTKDIRFNQYQNQQSTPLELIGVNQETLDYVSKLRRERALGRIKSHFDNLIEEQNSPEYKKEVEALRLKELEKAEAKKAELKAQAKKRADMRAKMLERRNRGF